MDEIIGVIFALCILIFLIYVLFKMLAVVIDLLKSITNYFDTKSDYIKFKMQRQYYKPDFDNVDSSEK